MGHDGALAIQAMIESARKPASGIMASLFGFFMLLVVQPVYLENFGLL